MDSVPSAAGGGIVSARLLRKQPTGATTSTDHYGSDWCGACHVARLSGHAAPGVSNHPVDSELTQPVDGPYTYENVVYPDNTMGTLGRNNSGYVMPEPLPEPRVSNQVGHGPICQQCHEDSRDVEAEFSVSAVDGLEAGDNPQFQVFPHESTNPAFLVETRNDLCTNCHSGTGK